MSMNSIFSNINFLAVVVVGFIHMAIGLIWYSPALFGKQWEELTRQEMKPARKWIPAGVIGHQLIALVLAAVVCLANATTAFGGFAIGIFLWLGFIVPLEIGELIWEKVPSKLVALRIGYHFVAMGIAGIILATWR